MTKINDNAEFVVNARKAISTAISSKTKSDNALAEFAHQTVEAVKAGYIGRDVVRQFVDANVDKEVRANATEVVAEFSGVPFDTADLKNLDGLRKLDAVKARKAAQQLVRRGMRIAFVLLDADKTMKGDGYTVTAKGLRINADYLYKDMPEDDRPASGMVNVSSTRLIDIASNQKALRKPSGSGNGSGNGNNMNIERAETLVIAKLASMSPETFAKAEESERYRLVRIAAHVVRLLEAKGLKLETAVKAADAAEAEANKTKAA